ncbi:MAG: hydantoinase B/oxoprolinase family protein [Acidobacteriota bacterium]
MSQRLEAVDLELFTHRFAAVAAEMGEMLQRTALSTNVRDRLDFSCALLDADGRLVVNAPHIPVHLGALGLCVRSVAAALDVLPGDVVVTNHPAYGGSHLPDVTVITPVDHDGRRLGWVASRAHHAEIGGIRAGSMPPSARHLVEEGVVIPPTILVRDGEARWDAMASMLREAPYPSRAVDDNLADLAAAVAANHRGAEALCRLADDHGHDIVASFMRRLRERARSRLRAALDRHPLDQAHAREHLDDGTPIEVSIQRNDVGLVVDFTGTGAVHPGNLNAPRAVARSAVLYVLRLLIAEPLPLNEGLLDDVEIVLPENSLLDPVFPDNAADAPAVVGGNVETSQRVVDTLVRAFGLVACGQGTMNNLLFGNDHFGYYETVCGGAGAGSGFAGADAVHTHMTNTRITDPEVLEARFPVRLERFAVRRDSGGAGRWRGGDGVIRELTFLEPVEVSLLSQHRLQEPFGMDGGGNGALGAQRLIRRDGELEELEGLDQIDAQAGDRFVLETPGGGAWGLADRGDEP